jgi:hypothetical protein
MNAIDLSPYISSVSDSDPIKIYGRMNPRSLSLLYERN